MTAVPIGTPPSSGALPPKKKRRVWPFVAVAIVLVVVIVGLFVADAAAKAYAKDRIRTELVSALGLSASTDVGVDVGSGSLLLQAISGKLDTVDVTVPKLAFGELVGEADIHATQVPLDASKPLDTLSVSYAVTEKNVAVLAKNLTSIDIDSVTLDSPQIVAKAAFSVFGAKIPVTLGLTPSVSGGQLVFTPTTIGAAGQTFTSEQLLANPVFGALAKTLLTQQSFCVAQYLPKALVANSVKVVGKTLVVTFRGNGAALGGSDFSTTGSCS